MRINSYCFLQQIKNDVACKNAWFRVTLLKTKMVEMTKVMSQKLCVMFALHCGQNIFGKWTGGTSRANTKSAFKITNVD